MFNPADAPSPKGWSKRRANAIVRRDHKHKMGEIRAIRDAHYQALAAGYANAEEHQAALQAAAEATEAVSEVVAPVVAEPVVEPGPAAPKGRKKTDS